MGGSVAYCLCRVLRYDRRSALPTATASLSNDTLHVLYSLLHWRRARSDCAGEILSTPAGRSTRSRISGIGSKTPGHPIRLDYGVERLPVRSVRGREQRGHGDRRALLAGISIVRIRVFNYNLAICGDGDMMEGISRKPHRSPGICTLEPVLDIRQQHITSRAILISLR